MSRENETLDRCPTCGAYTSAENGYIANDDGSTDLDHMDEGGLLRAYCNETCFQRKLGEEVKP
jgi:hypothetical protein